MTKQQTPFETKAIELLEAYANEYQVPYRFMTNDRVPMVQLKEARQKLNEEALAQLQNLIEQDIIGSREINLMSTEKIPGVTYRNELITEQLKALRASKGDK